MPLDPEGWEASPTGFRFIIPSVAVEAETLSVGLGKPGTISCEQMKRRGIDLI